VFTIVLLILYIGSLIVALKLLLKYYKRSEKVEAKLCITPPNTSPTAQFSSVWKIVKQALISSSTLISLISLILIIMLSAFATAYHLARVDQGLSDYKGDCVILEFSNSLSLAYVLNYLSEINITLKEYKRVLKIVFDEPLHPLIDSKKMNIYAAVLVDREVIANIMPSNDTILLGDVKLNKSKITINDVTLYVKGIKPIIMEEIKLYEVLSLLPIQGYVAANPVYVPPENTIVLDYNTGCKMLKLLEQPVTALIIPGVTLSETSIKELFHEIPSLSKLYVIKGGNITCFYNAIMPSWESLALAVLSSILASIMFIPTVSVIANRLKSIEFRALLFGLPPNTIALSTASMLALMFCTTGLIIIYLLSYIIGSYVIFNTIITLILALLFTSVYTIRTLASIGSKESPLPQGVSFIVGRNISDLLPSIEYLIKTNEFFEVIEYDVVWRRNEVYIYVSARYLITWGIGVNLHITLIPNNNNTKVSIAYKPWSIEEISDRYLNSMVRLFVGRLIGGLTPWRT